MAGEKILRGGAAAGFGLMWVLAFLSIILFKLALLVAVFGGAYWLLKQFGVFTGVPV